MAQNQIPPTTRSTEFMAACNSILNLTGGVDKDLTGASDTSASSNDSKTSSKDGDSASSSDADSETSSSETSSSETPSSDIDTETSISEASSNSPDSETPHVDGAEFKEAEERKAKATGPPHPSPTPEPNLPTPAPAPITILHTCLGRPKLTTTTFPRPERPRHATVRKVVRKLWMAEERAARARMGMSMAMVVDSEAA